MGHNEPLRCRISLCQDQILDCPNSGNPDRLSNSNWTMFHNGRHHRRGVFEDNLFDFDRLPHRREGCRRRARPDLWSSDAYDDEYFPSDFEGYGIRTGVNLGIGGRHRMRREDLDRGHGLHNGHNTRALALRIPARAPEPQVDLDEAFLFPQHVLHVTVHVKRHGDHGEVFRAAVPSSLTADEILAAVGLRGHSGYVVVVAWRGGGLVEEMPRDGRLASVVRRTGREPNCLYIERRRH